MKYLITALLLSLTAHADNYNCLRAGDTTPFMTLNLIDGRMEAHLGGEFYIGPVKYYPTRVIDQIWLVGRAVSNTLPSTEGHEISINMNGRFGQGRLTGSVSTTPTNLIPVDCTIAPR